MLYMLDTDISSFIIKKHPITVMKVMQNKVEMGHSICISSISYAELLLGAERSGNPQQLLDLIGEFSDRLDSIEAWDNSAAKHFSILQSHLFKQGTPIGANDTMIAAHALSTQAIMVTNNQKHFQKVPDLKLTNWINS